MSDPSNNPYAQLAAEHHKRIDAIIRGYHGSSPMQLGAIKMAEAVLAQCDAYEREFIRILIERQGTTPPDFDELYRRKAELDGDPPPPPAK